MVLSLPFIPMWSAVCLPPPCFPAYISHICGWCQRPSVPPSPARWGSQEKPSQSLGRKVWIYVWAWGRMEKSGLEMERILSANKEARSPFYTLLLYFPLGLPFQPLLPLCQAAYWGCSLLIHKLFACQGRGSSPTGPRARGALAFADFSRSFPPNGRSSEPRTLQLSSTPREHIMTCQVLNGTQFPQSRSLSQHLTCPPTQLPASGPWVLSITFSGVLTEGTSLTAWSPKFQIS